MAAAKSVGVSETRTLQTGTRRRRYDTGLHIADHDDGQIDQYEFWQIVKYLQAHHKITKLMPKYQ